MRLRALALACVAAWVGVVAFFSFVVAPLVFRTVDRVAAGLAVSAVLPHYYRWGVVLTAVALVAYLVAAARETGGRLTAGVAAALCAVMVVTLAWAWLVVLPSAEAARRAGGDTAFADAHRLALQLNALMLGAGVGVLALELLRRDRRRDR
jgi:Mn2+/Fe2+ NRAMP family transporter